MDKYYMQIKCVLEILVSPRLTPAISRLTSSQNVYEEALIPEPAALSGSFSSTVLHKTHCMAHISDNLIQ